MIRVVTAVPASMLEEMLSTQIDRMPGFMLMGKASDPSELPALVAETQADVVICCSTDSEQIPAVYRRLLNQFPQIVIVGVMPDDDAVVIYRQEVSRCELPSVGFGRLFSEIRRACDERAVFACPSVRVIARPIFGISSHPLRFSLN